MFCEQCGKEIPENSKFCSSCGAPVVIADPETPSVEPDPVVSAPEPEPTPIQEPPKTEQAPPPPPVQPAPQPGPAPAYQYNDRNNLVKPLSVGSYIGIFILMAIPIVNLIMLLVWSFSDTVNLNKKHYAIAVLVMILISILITVGLIILAATVGGGLYRYYFWQSF